MNCSEMCYDLFKNHVVINMGQSPKSEFYNNDGIGMPFLQGNRTFGFKYPYYDTYCSDIKKIAEKSDVLFSVRAPVGDVNIATERVCIGRGLASLRMKNGNQEYLYYLLKANRKYIENRENGTVFGSINKKGLEELEFYFPSDEVQNKISKVLTILDKKIELNNEMNKTLEEMAQALFKRWFVDFEFPNEEGKPYKSSGGEMVQSELGMIPKGWSVETTSKIVNVTDYVANGSFASLKQNVTYSEEEDFAILIRLVDYNKNFNGPFMYVDEKGYNFLSKSKLFGGEVIISNVGANAGTVFKVPKMNKPMTLGPNSIMLIPNEYTNYLYLFFTSFIGQEKLKSILSGSAQPKFNKTEFRNLECIMPNIDVINNFNMLMASIVEKNDKLREENNILIKLRDSLLPKLMSGEIRVEDIEASL